MTAQAETAIARISAVIVETVFNKVNPLTCQSCVSDDEWIIRGPRSINAARKYQFFLDFKM